MLSQNPSARSLALPLAVLLAVLTACTPGSAGDSAVGTGSGAGTGSTSLADACDQAPTGQISLPADDALHAESVEWWYWTGHLVDDQGRRYGFEQADFVFQLGSYLATSAHVALTDLDVGRFVYDIAYASNKLPMAVVDGFDITVEGTHAVGGNGQDSLTASIPDAEGAAVGGFALSLSDAKAPVLHHEDGYTDYDVGGYTWYYSRPRMDVTGTVTVDGEQRSVTGSGWFDHQWGDLMAASTAGWDWFGLQLDDDREVMLFMVKGSTELVGGTVLDAGCHATWLQPDEVSVEVTAEWTSPVTGCTYPAGWSIQVADESFFVVPSLADQELANDYDTYWEGVATVKGSATGRAYVELAGQCG